MASLIIKHDPVSSNKDIYPMEAGDGLVKTISSIYEKGFQTETKIYKDSPHQHNEINLHELKEDISVKEDDIFWVCHFPKGIEILIVGAVAAAVTYKAYSDVAEHDAQVKADEAVAAAQAAADAAAAEIPEETNLDSTTIGRGTSSNNVISAQSNQVRLGQKIPITYGYLRSFPDLIGDPYSEFSIVKSEFGNQVLYQYFGVSANQLSITEPGFDNIPRIGNQPLESTDEIELKNSNETFATYFDYVEHLGQNDTQELIQNIHAGDYQLFSSAGNTGSIVIDINSGAGTIEIKIVLPGVGGSSQHYNVYKALTQSDYASGDQFQMYSATSGLSGTFDLKSFEIKDENDNNPPSSPDSETVVLNVTSASGFTNGTYNGNYTYGLANLEGRFAGSSVRTDSNLPLPSTTPASGLKTILMNKRAQVVEAGTADFLTVNIQCPEGREISGASSSLTRFKLQAIQVDAAGNKLTNIGSEVNFDTFPPTTPSNMTLKIAIDQIAGRYLGLEIRRDDASGGLAYQDQNTTVVVRTKTNIVNAGHLIERTNYINGKASIISLTRSAKRLSEKKATGLFNSKVLTGLAVFDFNTGTFSGPTTFGENETSWIQVFMSHAVGVGKIAVSQIDYEQLKAIDDEIRTENGNQTSRFDFTFSNKASPIDEELSLICSSVRVIMYKDGSTYKFSRDQVKTKVGNITSRNCSFQGNVKAVAFSLPNPEDGIELEFINEETDKAEIIYVPEDRSFVRPKRLFISGVTDYTRAWRRAQYEFLLLFNRRVTRSVLTTKEAVLWDLMDRVTVYDHTRITIKPYETNLGGWRQETEVKEIDGTVIVGSEKLLTDTSLSFTSMAMELNLDLPDGTGLGVVQNVLINIDADDTRRFEMDSSVDPTLANNILNQIRIVSENGQIGERIFVYPVDVTDKQLAYDDYLINTKTPEGEQIRLELVRYNEDVYQFDNQNPPS